MPFAINCTLRFDALATLSALRLEHLIYIRDQRHQIMLGGPARDQDGLPQEMIIILHTNSLQEAEAFIQAEPYTVSGKVFSDIRVRPWSQVVPELSPGALTEAIARERSEHL